MAEYAHTVVARKWHWCDDTRGSQGRHRIPAGAPYATGRTESLAAVCWTAAYPEDLRKASQ